LICISCSISFRLYFIIRRYLLFMIFILLYILGVPLGLAERLSRDIARITDFILNKRESISLIKLNLDPQIIFLGKTIPRGLLLLLLLSLSAVLFFAFCVSRYIAFFFSKIVRVLLSVKGVIVTRISCGVGVSPWN
jgi:hypothetical protein